MNSQPRQMTMAVFDSTNLAGNLLWLIYKARQMSGAANQLSMETISQHFPGISSSRISLELKKLEEAGLVLKIGPDLYDLTEAGLHEIQRMG